MVPDAPISTHASSLEFLFPVIKPPHKRAKQWRKTLEWNVISSGTGVWTFYVYMYNYKQWSALVLTYICGRIETSRLFNNIWIPPAPEISEAFRFEADTIHLLNLQLDVDVSLQCQQNER
jgi:hypothetical protein